MQKKTKNNGITLVALVITIIVLLILAGVAINMAINSGGLFGKANEAAENWNMAVENESTAINGLLGKLDSITDEEEQQRLPEEYQEVEYIGATGTQYIDTGIIPNANIGIDIIYKSEGYSNSQYIAGSRAGSSGTIAFAVNGSGSRTDWDLRFDGKTTYSNVARNSNKWQSKFSMTNGTGTWTLTDLDEESSTTINFSNQTVTATGNLMLFSYNNVNIHSNLIIYSCKIYDGETLVRDFIPCYKTVDDVIEIGMYDAVNKVFYTNAGETGTFEKGADI